MTFEMTTKTIWRFGGLWAVLICVIASPVVMADSGARSTNEVSQITRQVSQEVYSPYCPGQTLAMCPSSNASEARQEIQDMARQGKSAEEIKQEMLSRYGQEFEMVEPPRRDQMTLLGGLIAGLAVAAVAVGVLARRRLGSDEADADDPERDDHDSDRSPGDDDEVYLEELRAEVRD